jgi:hypothetical protein
MSNPIILRRIKSLYTTGRITAEAMGRYVSEGLITQAEADEIMGVNA